MEVKAGYKQTEVGLIPTHWNLKPLGTIASIAAGGTPSRKVSAYWDGGIPWVTTTEVNFNQITATEQHISKLGLQNSAAKLLPAGTLLMALYGQGKTRGKVAILEIEATTNQACASIALSNDVSGQYVFQHLSGQYEAIRGLSNSGSQENLSGQIVKSLLIPLPPTKAEQEAIAEALSDADALIESLEQLVAKKQQIKHGAMQELLTGKRRLPGFKTTNSNKRSEAGVFPSDWNVAIIGVLAETSSGTTPARSSFDRYYLNGRIPWVKTLDLNNGEIIDTEERVTNAAISEANLQVYPIGTVLVAMYGGFKQIGRTGLLRIPAAINQALTAIRTNPTRLKSDYLLRFLNFRVDYWKLVASSSRKDPNITGKEIRDFPLVIPNIAEQTAIAAILSDMDAEIATLEGKLAKARQIKQGMMQELLTGRIRLV